MSIESKSSNLFDSGNISIHFILVRNLFFWLEVWLKTEVPSQAWWYIPLIPELGS